MFRYFMLLVLAVPFFASAAKADFFVQIKDSTTAPAVYAPGGTGVMEVYGRHTENAQIALNGFTISFDLSNNAVWDLNNTTATNAITGQSMSIVNLDPNFFTPNNYDFGFQTQTNGSFTMNQNQTYHLFDINFKVSNTAAFGSYNLSFIANALNNFVPLSSTVDANVVAYNSGSQFLSPTSNPALFADPVAGFNGTFIVGVPEPSSFSLFGIAFASLGFYRRKRN